MGLCQRRCYVEKVVFPANGECRDSEAGGQIANVLGRLDPKNGQFRQYALNTEVTQGTISK